MVMIAATMGIAGIALGIFLGTIRDWLFQRLKTRREYRYLAIQMTCMLDNFVFDCCNVACDDGTIQGQTGPGGARIQVTTPDLQVSKLDVEWKSLPHELAYEILNFPNLIKRADEVVSSVNDFSALPPDYEELFEARQFQYSTLGIRASKLATKLRTLARIPELEVSEIWDPVKVMKTKLVEIEEFRNARNTEHEAAVRAMGLAGHPPQ